MTLAVNTDENKRNIPSATMSSVRETPFCLSLFLSLRQRDANFPADPSCFASQDPLRMLTVVAGCPTLLIPLSILFTVSLALQGVVIAAIENRGSAVPASLALMLAVRPSDEHNHAGHRRIGRTRSGTSVERAGRELRGVRDGCCINGFVAFADIFVRTDSAG